MAFPSCCGMNVHYILHFVIRGPTNIYGGRFCEREYAQLYVKQLGSI